MHEPTSLASRTRCLSDLFTGNDAGILIPIIQRDYAQGRPEVEEVRERFLEALHEAMDGGAPLDLDFVYGYADDGSNRFVPIDGQQRLTTLFLLHWYLAHLDGQLQHFRDWAVPGGVPRFQYAVRTSSDDFLRELANCPLDLEQLLPADRGRHNALSKTLRDEHWFFRSWELDPTIRACLTMLDAIHTRFSQSTGLYASLIPPNPAITFQFLNLDEFGLGDELYIKMNARGRPLTDFEVFKSEVEKFVAHQKTLPDVARDGGTVPVHEHLGIQIDTVWSALLWQLLRVEHADDAQSDDWTRKLDSQLLNLMRTLAIVAHPDVEATGDEAETVDSWLEDLHNGVVTTFPGYARRNAMTTQWAQTLVQLMDLWCGPNGSTDTPSLQTFLNRTDYYDEADMFRRVRQDVPRRGDDAPKPSGAVTYTDLVRFAAYCLFLTEECDRSALDEWMRVTSNLARNTTLERGDSLRRALRGMRRALTGLEGGVLEHLATGGRIEGFSRQQIREERVKAGLINRSEGWRPLIERAELHPYFLGQIEFLLDFSGVLQAWSSGQSTAWSDEEDKEYQAGFTLALERSETLFSNHIGGDEKSEPGLRKLPDYLWERALLCQGDYLLAPSSGSARRSLGINRPEAQVSWKALLRGDLRDEDAQQRRSWVGQVFERIDPSDLAGSLQRVIDAGAEEHDDDTLPWREALVAHPKLLAYCRNRWLLWEWLPDDNDNWHRHLLLLNKKRRGPWQEVFTWVLGMELAGLVEQRQLDPFVTVEIVRGSGSAVRPCIELYLSRKKTPTYRIYCFPTRVEVRRVKKRKEVVDFRCNRAKLVKKIQKLAADHA